MTTIRTWRRQLKHPAAVAAGIAALVFAGLVTARWVGWLEQLELQVYDQYLRARALSAAPDPRIVLVTVTERDIEQYGHPVSDDLIAKLLERLVSRQPRAIGLDLFRNQPVPPGTERLAAVLGNEERIIGIMKFPNAMGERVDPPPAIKGTGRIGFADLVIDRDSVVRRGLLFQDDGVSEIYPSFALQLALLYLRPHQIGMMPDPADPRYLRLGPTSYTPLEPNDGGYAGIDTGGYQFLLTYPAGRDPFHRLSLEQVFDDTSELTRIEDHIVLIGTMAESVKDNFATPLSSAGSGEQVSHGVVLHGQIASQLIRQALGEAWPMRTTAETAETVWIWVWCALGVVPALVFHSLTRLATTAAAGSTLLIGLTYVAFAHDWWIPVVPPLLGVLASMGLTVAYISQQEKRERAMVMRLFSTYVSPSVAADLWAQRDAFLENGRPRPLELTATVLFSDVRGFTTVSERLPPEALVAWLSEYMEVMTDLIMAHGGGVEKFAGDGIIAMFGVPVPRTSEAEIAEDAQNAVRSALAMVCELERLNRGYEARGLPAIGIRVGIHTGSLVAGSIGSTQRMQYTIIGDTANTAARLESYKDGDDGSPCRILISLSTYRYLGPGYRVEPIGALSLKGKANLTEVYRLLGEEMEIPPPPEGVSQ